MKKNIKIEATTSHEQKIAYNVTFRMDADFLKDNGIELGTIIAPVALLDVEEREYIEGNTVGWIENPLLVYPASKIDPTFKVKRRGRFVSPNSKGIENLYVCLNDPELEHAKTDLNYAKFVDPSVNNFEIIMGRSDDDYALTMTAMAEMGLESTYRWLLDMMTECEFLTRRPERRNEDGTFPLDLMVKMTHPQEMLGIYNAIKGDFIQGFCQYPTVPDLTHKMLHMLMYSDVPFSEAVKITTECWKKVGHVFKHKYDFIVKEDKEVWGDDEEELIENIWEDLNSQLFIIDPVLHHKAHKLI